jgi:hypothetical protein
MLHELRHQNWKEPSQIAGNKTFRLLEPPAFVSINSRTKESAAERVTLRVIESDVRAVPSHAYRTQVSDD